MQNPVIYFCFADPKGFSGQKDATKLIMAGLSGRGWTCRSLPQPVLERSDGKIGLVRYGMALLLAWLRSLRLLWARGACLHLNMGQTRFALLRDSVPLLCGAVGLRRSHIVISLHGSLFMQWPDESLQAGIFRFLLQRAGLITVSGNRQRARLLALGLPEAAVISFPNTCDLPPITAPAMAAKHAGTPNRSVRLLYLSSLIDTKGFPEYLEALGLLASGPGPSIEATLCGQVVPSEFSVRFVGGAGAKEWIEGQLAALNASDRVRVRWLPGVVGEAKARLQHETDIFVLPTYYPVESQPLVLLEAMAAGSAIVTTGVGEIESILDERCAIFLPKVDAPTLAGVLARLIDHPSERARLANASWEQFLGRFQPARHLDRWERIFSQAENP